MAAKQGLSAQISQASEDAKRAVLGRANLTNSLWFSNLNTTCTIKSAPPRTPDVLGLLSVKSGWMFKRNEQHVWQARYCCVVPHTFLYYFDAHPTDAITSPTLSAKQQEELNASVRQGYGKRGALKHKQPRSSLYHVLGTGASNPPLPIPDDTEPSSGLATTTLQPAGIIDLECYTTVHRNSQNQLLMELAGDETVNPDLRSFYFCANDEEEGEEWTQAFLAERHSALTDEKEAYRQVCDGFAQQLQMLHSDLENAQQMAEQQQDELYRVRSQMEDTRRSCLRLVQDSLERSEQTLPANKAYRTDLETIQAQDLGILAAVQLLCDYTRVLEETCSDSGETISKLESQLEQKQEGDSSRVNQLEAEIDQLKADMNQQQSNWQTQLEMLQQKHIQSQKECRDVQKDLASQRMEMTMYQSSTRTKFGELQSHKKILKKEVIALRKGLEEAHSHLDLFKHKESSVKLEAASERQKAKLLERYVEKMESQVKVQQNMMEMLSQAGSQYGGSQYGGGSNFGGTPDYQFEMQTSPTLRSVNKAYSPSGQREYGNLIANTPSSVQPDDDEEDDDDDLPHALPTSNSKRTGRRTIDDDAKSHMSELTEDRTQKQFDVYMYQGSTLRPLPASPRNVPHQTNLGGPPSIIGVAEDPRSEQAGHPATPKKLDTIMTAHKSSSLNARNPSLPRNDIPRYDVKPHTPRNGGGGGADAGSVSSYGSKSKLTVAQRARLEADRQTTPIRVRLQATGSTPIRGNNSSSSRKEPQTRLTPTNIASSSSNNSLQGSFFSNLGRRLEDAIVGDSTSESSYSGTDIGTDNDTDIDQDRHQEEKKNSETVSEASTSASRVSLSLGERQALQRAQQLQFLKEQGLIANEQEVRGGAGGSSPRHDSASSVNAFSRNVRDPPGNSNRSIQ